MEWRQSEKNVLVVGHRGARALYPENTMVSFREAISLGVDGIEMDVNISKDGQLMVIHDNMVDRTTNGIGMVADFSLKELKQLDAGSHFSPDYAGEQIPTFEEFCDLVKDKPLYLNVEIKDYRREVVDKTMKMLDEFSLLDRSVITCFYAGVTTYIHKEYGAKTQGFPEELVKNFRPDTNSHYYAVGIPMRLLNREICDRYRAMNIDPWCWCPDTEEEVLKVIESTSSLVTVNDPGPALRVLKEKGLRG